MGDGFIRVVQQRQHRLHDADSRLGIGARWRAMFRSRCEVSPKELVGPIDQM
jgi:hypothetical protein